MKRLKGGVLITPKDIQLITNYHIKVAEREHRFVRDALGKKSRRLSVREYCNFFELDYDEIVELLNHFR